MQVTLIPAFDDNYLFSIEENDGAMIVDPGSAPEVLAHLKHEGLKLERILVTHHHGDHIGGVLELPKLDAQDIKNGLVSVPPDGLRLAFSVLLARTLGLGHAFWVVLGTLSVLRSNALGTGRTTIQALAGSVIGFVAGGLFAAVAGNDPVLMWIAMPIAVIR